MRLTPQIHLESAPEEMRSTDRGQRQAFAALLFEAEYGAIGGLGKRHLLQIDTFGCRQIAQPGPCVR